MGYGTTAVLVSAVGAVATAPGLTLLNPLVAVLCGVLLFGETPRPGVWALGAAVGAVLLVAGTMRLAGSPTLAGGGGPRRREAGRFVGVTPGAARTTVRATGSTRGPRALPPSEGQPR